MSTTIPALDLPDHRQQSPAVADRFRRLGERPVVLEGRGLCMRYPGEAGGEGYTALRDVNFRVHRREFLSVIGPSGCGKSTLARLIAGLERPTGGEIRVDGKHVEGPGPDRGMVFQGYTLFPWLNVTENVMFGPRMSGIGRGPSEAEALPATSVAARRFRVAPPDDAPELVVTVVEGGREATWTLALGRFEELPAIREARAARAERRFDSAKDVLVGALAQAGLTDADRARLLGMRARVAISQGDLEAAEELLVVLEKIAERRIRRFGGDRRRETFTVCHAREHLEWHRAQRLG